MLSIINFHEIKKMFTGIIQEIGSVQLFNQKDTGATIQIRCTESLLSTVRQGDSIAVNGVCLTATTISSCKTFFTADIVQETLKRSNLYNLKQHSPVNLELPLLYNGKIDGHLVQGHVDEVGVIKKKRSLSDGSWEVSITPPLSLLRFIVEKGSITVDGTSLTVFNVDESSFSFAMIPHTAKKTILGTKAIGEKVNLEVDILAKYMEKMTIPYKATTESIL